jgi:hypothetical protein
MLSQPQRWFKQKGWEASQHDQQEWGSGFGMIWNDLE